MDNNNTEGPVVVETKHSRFGLSGMVNESKKNSKHSKFFHRLKLVVVIILGVGVLGIVMSKFVFNEKPVLVIGDQKIYKKQYDELVAQAKKRQINTEGAKNTIIDGYRYEQAAKKIGIEFGKSDLASLEEQTALQTTVKNDFYYLGLKKAYIQTQLEIRKQDGFDGYAFYFPFSRNFLDSDPKTTNPLFNNADAIEKDRVAAKQKADDARNRLIDNKTKPSDLVDEILADDSLIYGNASNGTQHFFVNKLGYEVLNSSGSGKRVAGRFIDILPSIPEGKATEIKDDIQTYTEVQSGAIVTKNAAYYFVYKVKNVTGSKDVATQFSNALKEVQVVDNVKN